jgi:hypothetical protein
LHGLFQAFHLLHGFNVVAPICVFNPTRIVGFNNFPNGINNFEPGLETGAEQFISIEPVGTWIV